jgi:hypothetical protein
MENTYNQQIIQSLGIDNLDPIQQETITHQFLPLLLQSVMTRAVTQLSVDQAEHLMTIPQDDLAGMLVFLDTHVPDFSMIWDEEIKNTRADIDMMLGRYVGTPA